MSEGRDGDDDILGDYWITSWEQQAVQELESEADHQQHLHAEADAANEKMWVLFQSAAQCVAVMYKGAQQDSQNSMWVPFQTAAGHITALYKDAVDYVKRSGEVGVQAGYQRRTRDVLNWARRRRHFRREELIAFLAGKSPPPKTSHLRGSPRTRIALERISPRLPSPHHHGHMHAHNPDPELNTFREALGISGQPGLNVRPQPVGSPTLSARRRNSTHLPELQAFLCDEFARNKRPAPSSSPTHDVTMDSPQHKRSRFT